MFPLMLSWFSTIHHARGFTVDIVYVYGNETIFADGQTDVTLSRVKKELQNLHIKSLHCDAFRTSSTVKHILATVKEERLLRTVPVENRCYHGSSYTSLNHHPEQNSQNKDTNEPIINTSDAQFCHEMQHVHAQMAWLGNEKFHLGLF